MRASVWENLYTPVRMFSTYTHWRIKAQLALPHPATKQDTSAPMQRLAKPLSAMRAAMMWSWSAPAMAAASRPRGCRGRAKRSRVLERGREYPTGSFPKKLTEIRSELMVSGGRFGNNAKPGLYDFRYGDAHPRAGRLRPGRRLAGQCRRVACGPTTGCSPIRFSRRLCRRRHARRGLRARPSLGPAGH